MQKRANRDGRRPIDEEMADPARKGDRKEQAILDTAWQLLGTKPMSSISIDELARGAGISRPTFYFYFDSREAVMRALGMRTLSHLRRTTADLFHSGDDPRRVIRDVVTGLLERWEQHGPVLRAISAASEHDDDLRSFYQSITDGLLDSAAAVIEQERAAGVALPGPPSSRDLAAALFAMQWRAGYEYSLDRPSRAGRARLISTLTEICVRAIYGPI
jgi:AcrR family transcriptional regulator